MKIFSLSLTAAILCIVAGYVVAGADTAIGIGVIAFPIIAIIYYDRFMARD